MIYAIRKTSACLPLFLIVLTCCGCGKIAENRAHKGVEFARKGMHEQAIKEFSKAIYFKPDYALAYSNRGIIYGMKGELKLALIDFDKAVAIDPKYPDAYYGRGLAYVKQNNINSAMNNFNKAIELNPKYADAYRGRSLVYFLKQDYPTALKDLEKVKELGGPVDSSLMEALKNPSAHIMEVAPEAGAQQAQ